ncbi:hypothetical protein FRC11_002852, partial [Ceratobasidium sp. 423]
THIIRVASPPAVVAASVPHVVRLGTPSHAQEEPQWIRVKSPPRQIVDPVPQVVHLKLAPQAPVGPQIIRVTSPPSKTEVIRLPAEPAPAGLASAYRSEIRNFARIAELLTNLTHDVQRTGPQAESRGRHRKAFSDARVTLSDAAKKAFVELKVALTSNPVLKAPVYDGRPFTITTSGSTVGFRAVVSQVWEERDSLGVTHKVTYPIAFAYKRTSRMEERHQPFLLEFAALKFACDEVVVSKGGRVG